MAPNILIADPSETILQSQPTKSSRTDSPLPAIQPVFVSNEENARIVLSNKKLSLCGILINPAISPMTKGASVIRVAHEQRPATSIYLMTDTETSFDLAPEELRKLGIQKVLKKPVSLQDLENEFRPRLPVFHFQAALEAATRYQSEEIGQEISEEDSKYHPIRASDFLAGTISYFDIYIRLQTGRYLKLLQAGDFFTLERIAKYLEKGLIYFYIRKDVQEHYLTYCDQIAHRILNQNKPELADIAVTQTLNQGEETLKFLQGLGVSEGSLQNARDFLRNVQRLTSQLNTSKDTHLTNFLNDLALYEHASSITLISSVLIRRLDFSSANPVESVGLASFLHDIGLKLLNLELLDEEINHLTEQEKTVFFDHPIVGADHLKTLRSINPIVTQAVAQHHERRNKSGYPLRIGAGSLSMVSEVVGLSHEFHEIIVKTRSNPNLDWDELIKTRILNSFSQGLVTEFKKVFLSKEQNPSQSEDREPSVD